MADKLTDTAIKVLFTLDLMERYPDMPDEEYSAGMDGLHDSIRESDSNDFDSDGEVNENGAGSFLIRRLVDAQFEGKLREQYIKELEKEEKYELLAKIL